MPAVTPAGIATATQRAKRPLRGPAPIGLRVGKVLGRYKVGKHFTIEITERTALTDIERTIDTLRKLRLLGVRVSRGIATVNMSSGYASGGGSFSTKRK